MRKTVNGICRRQVSPSPHTPPLWWYVPLLYQPPVVVSNAVSRQNFSPIIPDVVHGDGVGVKWRTVRFVQLETKRLPSEKPDGNTIRKQISWRIIINQTWVVFLMRCSEYKVI